MTFCKPVCRFQRRWRRADVRNANGFKIFQTLFSRYGQSQRQTLKHASLSNCPKCEGDVVKLPVCFFMYRATNMCCTSSAWRPGRIAPGLTLNSCSACTLVYQTTVVCNQQLSWSSRISIPKVQAVCSCKHSQHYRSMGRDLRLVTNGEILKEQVILKGL
jgi:hypothetical protein